MKTGIYVRIGKENKDLTELDDEQLAFWVGGLSERERLRLIVALLLKVKEVTS